MSVGNVGVGRVEGGDRRERMNVSVSRAESCVMCSWTVCGLEEAGAIEQKWAGVVFCLGSVLRLGMGANCGCAQEGPVGASWGWL